MKKLLIVDDCAGSDCWIKIARCFDGISLKVLLPEKYKETIHNDSSVHELIDSRVEGTEIDFGSGISDYGEYLSDVDFAMVMPCGINTFADLVNGYVKSSTDVCVAIMASKGKNIHIFLNVPDILTMTPGFLANIKRSTDCPCLSVRHDIVGVGDTSLARLRSYIASLKMREGQF